MQSWIAFHQEEVTSENLIPLKHDHLIEDRGKRCAGRNTQRRWRSLGRLLRCSALSAPREGLDRHSPGFTFLNPRGQGFCLRIALRQLPLRKSTRADTPNAGDAHRGRKKGHRAHRSMCGLEHGYCIHKKNDAKASYMCVIVPPGTLNSNHIIILYISADHCRIRAVQIWIYLSFCYGQLLTSIKLLCSIK